MKTNSYKKGFTVIEMIISIFIISLVTITVTTFQKDVFSLNYSLQGSLNAQIDARHVVKVMVSEMREMSQSSLGAYPIALASTSAITFYSDIDNDGLKDKIRYFLSGTNLRRGVVAPSGNPLTYNDATEKLTTVISGFTASSTSPLFQYYPSTYSGTSSPLTAPINLSLVRLIKVTVTIDKDPNHSPTKVVVSSQVSLRNLKDNL